MSVIGSPIDTSLVQAAQAQQTASKARDRERVISERGQRYTDMLELRVAGVESGEAVRQLPHSDSEQADHEREGKKYPARRNSDDGDDGERLDVTA